MSDETAPGSAPKRVRTRVSARAARPRSSEQAQGGKAQPAQVGSSASQATQPKQAKTSTRRKPTTAARRSPRKTLEVPPEAEATAAEGAVVITGICGRMGRLLCRKLHRVGPVIGIDRRRFDGKPEDVDHYQLDLRRRKTRDIFRAGGIRAVVHLGTMHNLRESDRTHHSWNVVGFQKLLEYLSQYQVPKLVVLSSATLYGPSPENPQFLTEDAPLLGAQEFSQIRDLVEVDMLAQSFFWKNPEVETVILRPCHILGRVRNASSNYARMERPITVMGFDPMMQVIHERDVVEAIALALQPGARGIYNLRGPGELPISRMWRMMGKRPRALPGPVIKGVLGRLWSYRASNFPTPELDHLRYICMVSDERARRELGFKPKYSLEQTLRSVEAER